MAVTPPKYKWPKTLGAMADRMYELQQERLALDRQSEAIKAEQTALGDHLLVAFPKEKLEGAKGKIGQTNIKRKDVPAIDDWDEFYKHLKKTGEFDLLQRRPHEAAFTERWENGKSVPGTSKFTRISISISKAS